MATTDFFLGQNDTASPLFETLEDSTGAPVDIQGATIKVTITPIHGGTPIVNAHAANNKQNADGSDGTKGQVSYGELSNPWGTATATAGDFLYFWEVTFSGGTIQSFPNDGFRLLTITADPPTSAQRYASVDELKKTLNLRGTTYADADLALALAAGAQMVENICGRKFTTGTPGETRLFTPLSNTYCRIDDLQANPTSVTSFGQTFTQNTDYYLYPVEVARPGPPYDLLRPSAYSFLWAGITNSISITGTWGWPTVPDPVKQATMMIAFRLLKRVREAPFGIITFGDEGEAMRLTRADPDLLALLSPYTRQAPVMT